MSTHRGVSLVEVLVVLVILVIGMFAITRIFPQGFVNLNFTQNLTLANALAQHREDEMRKAKENIPDAVVAFDPINNVIRTSILPEEFFNALPLNIPGNTGTPPDDPRYSDVNWVRRVIGEQVKVPPPTVPSASSPFPAETVSLYRLLFTPVYTVDASAAAPFHPGVMVASGTPHTRVHFQSPYTQENADELIRLETFGYGMDYDRNTLYFQATPYERRFRIQATYRVNNGAPQQLPPGFTFTVPAGANPGPFGPPNTHAIDLIGLGVLPAGAEIDQGSDFLYRAFVKLDVGTPFGQNGDPYEFKVYDTVFGLIGFNPITASIPLPFQQGRGLTVKIDYDVDDWHIMRQDEVVPVETTDPTTGFHSVRLSTGAIKRLGETEDTINFVPPSLPNAGQDTFEYQGLVRYYPDTPSRPGTPGIDLVIVDLQTGLHVTSRTLQKVDGTEPVGTTGADGEIDYDKGVIHLRDTVNFTVPGSTTTVPLNVGGRHIRVYYRTYNDFAVATIKPFTNYNVNLVPPTLREQQYYPGYGAGYLLFNSMEADRTMAVDYSYLWQDPVDPTNRRLVNVIGELQKVQPPSTPFAPVPGCTGPGTLDPTGYWWIRLAHADTDGCKGTGDGNADPTVVPGSVRVTGLRGASFHTRVAWRDAKRWRQRQRTTILTREQTR